MDSYKTILESGDHFLWKDKNSKFYAAAFAVQTANDLKSILVDLKKRYPKAGHFCFAYKIGVEPQVTRVNDDGEPNNSAGNAILGQIQSFGLTNVLVVVVRYFGGTKLGVSGLISAYKLASHGVLNLCTIVEKTIDLKLEMNFELKNINIAMRIIKENQLSIISQKNDQNAQIVVFCPKKDMKQIFDKFKHSHQIILKIIE